jgi:flagellar hook-associated protein 3 FlgL
MRFDPNFSSSVLDGITQSDAAFQTAEQQLSTGLRVNQASDDPAAAAAYTQNQTALAAVDQYTTNTSSALSMAQTASSALSSVVSLLTQAVTLGTAAATPVSESSEKSSLAAEAQGILASIVSAANTTFAGVAVFGGSSGSSTAFVSDSSSTTGYSYAGSSNANDAQIGTTLSVTTGLPGSTVFTQTGSSVLGAMSQLVSSVTSGSSTQIAAATNAVTNALNYVSQQQASIGDTITTLNTQDNYLGQEKVTLSAQQSSLVDISSATAAENVNNAQIQNSAVLAAAAKILPESLLNFLNK